MVAPSAPDLLTVPRPIAVAVGGPDKNVQLIFSETAPSAETYSVSIDDPLVATSPDASWLKVT